MVQTRKATGPGMVPGSICASTTYFLRLFRGGTLPQNNQMTTMKPTAMTTPVIIASSWV